MNLDDFRVLREIFSLLNSVKNLKSQIAQEESRLSSLDQKRLQASQDKEELELLLFGYNQSLATIDLQLSQRLNETVKTNLENQGLEILEIIEVTTIALDDKKSFLAGLEITFKEIECEVLAHTQPKRQEITSHQTRIEVLKASLPIEMVSKFDDLMKKNLPFGPFTSNQGGKCQFCLRTLSKIEESEIDVKLIPKTCNSCGRIFLPYDVLH